MHTSLKHIICIALCLWGFTMIFPQTGVKPDAGLHAGQTLLATAPNAQAAEQIRQGVRAFVVSADPFSIQNINAFSALSAFLDTAKQDVFVLILKSKISEDSLSVLLKNTNLKNHLFPPTKNIPDDNALIKSNKRLLIFTHPATALSYNIAGLKFSDYKSLWSENKAIDFGQTAKFCYSPLTDNLTRFSTTDTMLLHRSFFSWLKKGRKPDLVLVKPEHVTLFAPIVDSLNRSLIYSGVIMYKDQLLNEIRWSDRPGTVSNGVFSFPQNIIKDYELYTPWKEGYSFYPEVVKFDENNLHQEFSAIKLSQDDELIYNFDFEKGVRNKVDKTLYENELFSVCFRNVKGHGKVLCLNKDGAAVQFKKSPEFDTSKPFTISAWVNPDSVNAIHTIVSKGLVFSLKIRRGGLSFSGTGFQSVILDSLLIEAGKWQHISCVYVPGYHVQFFLNGQLVHDEAFDSLRVSEQALTIGNNFSNEAYSGQIDDLMIWNRALSADEIELLFSERNKSSVFPLLLWSFIIVIVLLLVFFILVRSGKMQLKPLVIKTRKEEISSSESQQRICLFGELFISGINGDNLAKQLTPRLKQLFVLLAIHPNGVSIGRINNDLWPGVDDEKAKQSRNYAIQQLKKVLSANPAIRLEYLSKNWILQFDENIKVDALLLEDIGEQLTQQFSVSLLDAYLSIAERGKFLPGIDNECFDAIKTKISENISTHVLVWAENATPKTCLRLGNILLLQDSLSEDGLRISVRALAALGRNGEAMELYQTFAKRYKNTYNEVFSSAFQSFI